MIARTTIRNCILLLGAVLMLAMPATCLGLSRVIANVYTSSETLDFSNDGKIIITYSLEKPGASTITIWNSDFIPVRQFNRPTDTAGLNTFIWDGIDQNGRQAPDGSYFLTINSSLSDNSTATYDPTLTSGGEPLPIPVLPESYDRQTGMIGFSLPVQAMVRLRAGLRNGPVYTTLLDWTDLAAGKHQAYWDGFSDDKIVEVASHPDIFVTVEAYTLPDRSFIVQNSPTASLNYSPPALQTDMDMHFPPRKFDLISNKMKLALPFSLKINTITPTADSSIAITDKLHLNIEADQSTMAALSQNRFELVVFVDDIRFDEVEYAYMPLTYILNTDNLSAGEHLVTLNLFTITGQRTARSARINLQKD